MAVEVAYLRGDTPLRVWVDDESETVCLSVGPPPGQVVLGLTISGASRLLEAVQRELKVLDPAGYDCDDCLDTGEQWVPMAPGSVGNRACHCPAARR
ncbi:hypothetical protein [Saccharothrix deserti]|uniref:hypothetical protein n=1 Tax=Saccharothrix deserti TaxID=2593674 RepID=UPI00131DF9C2|nr:hypothetical protein [Saccharothrix deserti]